MILNPVVGPVAREATALKIGAFFSSFSRRRTHPYGERKRREKSY